MYNYCIYVHEYERNRMRRILDTVSLDDAIDVIQNAYIVGDKLCKDLHNYSVVDLRTSRVVYYARVRK